MRLPGTKSVLIATGCLLFGGVMALFALRPPPEIQWQFLNGKKPFSLSETEFGWGVDTRWSPHPIAKGPPRLGRTRSYKFRGTLAQVVGSVAREIEGKGGKHGGAQWPQWDFPGGGCITVGPLNDGSCVSLTVVEVRDEGPYGYARRWVRSLFR